MYLHFGLSCLSLDCYSQCCKSVVESPSKGISITFLFYNPLWFSLFAKCISLKQKRSRAQCTQALQSKPDKHTQPRGSRSRLEAEAIPRGSGSCLCASFAQSPCNRVQEYENNEKANNRILTRRNGDEWITESSPPTAYGLAGTHRVKNG